MTADLPKIYQPQFTEMEMIWIANSLGTQITSVEGDVVRMVMMAKETVELRNEIEATHPGGLRAFHNELSAKIARILGWVRCGDCGDFHMPGEAHG